MFNPLLHEKSNLIIAVTFNENFNLYNLLKILEKKFGSIENQVKFNFSQYTTYYQKQMGVDLDKIIFSFEDIIDIENIYKVKRFTNKLEMLFTENRDGIFFRNVNIDPGYLTLSKFILMTTKNYSHRIYLNKGIFAEITLNYYKQSFNSCSWTYPDYKQFEVINFFNNIRKNYKIKLEKSKKEKDTNLNSTS